MVNNVKLSYDHIFYKWLTTFCSSNFLTKNLKHCYNRPIAQWHHVACQNTLPNHFWIKLCLHSKSSAQTVHDFQREFCLVINDQSWNKTLRWTPLDSISMWAFRFIRWGAAELAPRCNTQKGLLDASQIIRCWPCTPVVCLVHTHFLWREWGWFSLDVCSQLSIAPRTSGI